MEDSESDGDFTSRINVLDPRSLKTESNRSSNSYDGDTSPFTTPSDGMFEKEWLNNQYPYFFSFNAFGNVFTIFEKSHSYTNTSSPLRRPIPKMPKFWVFISKFLSRSTFYCSLEAPDFSSRSSAPNHCSYSSLLSYLSLKANWCLTNLVILGGAWVKSTAKYPLWEKRMACLSVREQHPLILLYQVKRALGREKE